VLRSSIQSVAPPDVLTVFDHPDVGFEQEGLFHSSAAQAKRYSLAADVVSAAEDQGLVEVSDS